MDIINFIDMVSLVCTISHCTIYYLAVLLFVQFCSAVSVTMISRQCQQRKTQRF